MSDAQPEPNETGLTVCSHGRDLGADALTHVLRQVAELERLPAGSEPPQDAWTGESDEDEL